MRTWGLREGGSQQGTAGRHHEDTGRLIPPTILFFTRLGSEENLRHPTWAPATLPFVPKRPGSFPPMPQLLRLSLEGYSPGQIHCCPLCNHPQASPAGTAAGTRTQPSPGLRLHPVLGGKTFPTHSNGLQAELS